MEHARPDLFAHAPAAPLSLSYPRPEPLQASQTSAMGGSQTGNYLGANVVTPRQAFFSRDHIDASAQFPTMDTMENFAHNTQTTMPAAMPRAAQFGSGSGSGIGIGGGNSSSSSSSSSAVVGSQHTFAPATTTTWSSSMQQQPDSIAYSRYAYPSQAGANPWATPGVTTMSQSVIYDSSSSTHTSPNRSQTYYDMPSSEHFDHASNAFHTGTHMYPVYGPSTSKIGGPGTYISAPQPEYQPEEIDSMLNQVSSLYKAANTKKMAEFYRDKWARMWLTCNYTLKPSIQISIPRTILHESYRRACDALGLEPLQAASFGKVLRSQFPDVVQRSLGGRGKTRFHYCGFGTSNDREAVKVKSLLEEEKAGRLQLSAGISAEYAAEARGKARSEGHEAETSSSSYRTQASSDASQYGNSPHASSESSGMGPSGIATDDRLIASAFATLNSAVLTPPGTSSGVAYSSQDTAQYAQVPSQGHSSVSAQLPNGGGSAMPRRHTVSHSYSGLSDLSFLPAGMHATTETGETGVMHATGEVAALGPGVASGVSEPLQSTSLLNSPASSLHGYQYLQDPRHVPSSMPFRRSCQDFADWSSLPGQQDLTTIASSNAAGAVASATSTGFVTGPASGNAASHELPRKAWSNNFVFE